jgi:ribosomal subunit interface protein
VDIVITGRHTDVSEKFRRLAEEKLSKVGPLAPKAQRADVELSHERNPRQSSTAEKVEITVRGKGPVIRAEACADDPYAALDIAFGKLLERMRRTRDRRKVHHGRQTPPSLRLSAVEAAALEPVAGDAVRANGLLNGASGLSEHEAAPHADEAEASPVVIRSKDHHAQPMTVDQALYEMEMVGHDFYLFVDVECGRPSVVYRRHGWEYGVIRLSVDQSVEALV